MRNFFLIVAGLTLLAFAGLIFFNDRELEQVGEVPAPMENDITASSLKKDVEVVLPVAEFFERISKKPFGIYITPENSPVQPERFTGYHVGVDVEYEDIAESVPVYAVCDGEVVLAKWVAGYGGTMAIKCGLDSQSLFFIYGHLDQQSFAKSKLVKTGDQIAILGEGETRQTDFERKHLHLAIKKDKLDLRGYVDKEEELAEWLDPGDFF
jgi:murein DD-endopeptidase MepM/ murein hydrolase activator NlpD